LPDQTDTAEAEADQVREEVSAWLAANWDPQLTVRAWWEQLADSGWGFPTWPKEWFGRDLHPDHVAVVRSAFHDAGAMGPPAGMAQSMGGPVLLQHGTDAQKNQFLPEIATGREWWCQFFSEPGAGSDLASVQTRAMRDGDEWIVNGQKVWSSSAHHADRGLLLCRTDSSLPKHRGLSFFIINTDQPGIELRPIVQMNFDAHFNESFFDDARVPDANMVGDLNNGWLIALAVLAFERTAYAGGGDHSLPSAAPGLKSGQLDLVAGDVMADLAAQVRGHTGFPIGSANALVDLARQHNRWTDALIRQRVMRLHCLAEASRLTTIRAQAAAEAGKTPGSESSVGYMAGVLLARQTRDLALEIMGIAGTLMGEDSPDGGRVALMAITTPCHGIMGGSEQIQKNIVGERMLGLPREPQVDRDLPFRDLKVGTQSRS
jgi:alkylation response protein AidB-like acyl-CoA dehydrogenase